MGAAGNPSHSSSSTRSPPRMPVSQSCESTTLRLDHGSGNLNMRSSYHRACGAYTEDSRTKFVADGLPDSCGDNAKTICIYVAAAVDVQGLGVCRKQHRQVMERHAFILQNLSRLDEEWVSLRGALPVRRIVAEGYLRLCGRHGFRM